MSKKIKPRQQKMPRSAIAYDAITRSGAGPHKFRSEKRQRNPRNNWQADHGI